MSRFGRSARDAIGFRDSFDGATAPLYGLNDALSTRQQGPGAITAVRLDAPPSAPATRSDALGGTNFNGA